MIPIVLAVYLPQVPTGNKRPRRNNETVSGKESCRGQRTMKGQTAHQGVAGSMRKAAIIVEELASKGHCLWKDTERSRQDTPRI